MVDSNPGWATAILVRASEEDVVRASLSDGATLLVKHLLLAPFDRCRGRRLDDGGGGGFEAPHPFRPALTVTNQSIHPSASPPLPHPARERSADPIRP